MTETEFMEKELQLLDDIRNSEPYLSWKELSKKVEEDPLLCRLSKERDEILKKADCAQGGEKEKLLSSFREKTSEMNEVPLMKEYKMAEERMRKILNYLSDGLNKEIL